MQHRTDPKANIRPPKPVVSSKKASASKNLSRDWKKLPNKNAILIGMTSQDHKKYKGHNDQGAAVCIVANVFASLTDPNSWTKEILDKVIECGTNLYLKSLQMCEDKCLRRLDPPKIYKYVYIDFKKVSIYVGMPPIMLRLFKDSTILIKMQERLDTFFKNNSYGILGLLRNYLAIWKLNNQYYIFNSSDCDLEGGKWNGIQGQGHSFVMRCPSIKSLADTISKTVDLKPVNKFMLYPFRVDNIVLINRTPPDSKTKAKNKTLQAKTEKTIAASITPTTQSSLPLPKIPPTKPRLASATNFVELIPTQVGILRASSHQQDLPTQSLSNAIASLIMLRICKSKHWTCQILDNILKLGDLIHYNSRELKSGEVPDKITYKDKNYSPQIDKIAAVGQLKSNDDTILNLEDALGNILSDIDCCILMGPNLVAIWKDDNRYYMFDPNKRNSSGKIPIDESGVACLTWFHSIGDLTNMYMANISKNFIKSRFTLCKVTIEDHKPLAENWYNFQALTGKKWILRGNFSQQDQIFPLESRNAQCTANAALALAYKELKEEKDWDDTIVDKVLLNGDKLYRDCVQDLQDAGKFKDKYLMVNEIKRSFDLENKKVNLEIDDCLVNGVINAKSDTNILNLKKGFEKFFLENEAGIVTANSQSMAVWRRNNFYYYYDSHSRDKIGVVCGYGTACVLRLVDIDDLTNALTVNLGPDKQNFYNISRIVVRLLDVSEDGVVIPALNNYQSITDFVAILRGNLSQEDKKFGISAGKQTIPNCLAALGLNALTASNEWDSEDIDQVLLIGDTLYAESMEINYKNEDILEDAISTYCVKKKFKIGTNLIQIEFEDLAQGNIQDNISEAFKMIQNDTQAILESEFMTVSLWFNDNLFYLFDPKARNERGEIYGKDNWSVQAEVDLNDSLEFEDIDEIAGGDNLGELSEEQLQTNVHYDEDKDTSNQNLNLEEETSNFRQQEERNGKACILRFCKLENLIEHITENTPPKQRQELEFTLKQVKITNIVHKKEEEQEEFVGDWNSFKKVKFGKWILRGGKSMNDCLFPENNRKRQEIPMCLVALVFVNFYELSHFKQDTVDDILSYGDRLFSLVVKSKKHKLEKIKQLSERQIDNILLTSEFSINHYPKTIVLDEKKATWMIENKVVAGDLTSTIDAIFNIQTGLEQFFAKNHHGVIECRKYFAAIWKKDDVFFMFDSHATGPSGIKSPVGVACITRFKNINDLAELFLNNLPKIGNNFFEIHSIEIKQEIYVKIDIPPSKEPKIPKMGGFVEVILGKYILRGDQKLDSSKFVSGIHLHSSAIAFTALALSISKNPDTWTAMMIDEIIKASEELYDDSINQLGDKFNSWEDKLSIYQVNPDFRLGSLKVNFALRFMEQHGLVDIKNSKIPNLRQGLEKFFEENSHGILLVDKLILPIWHQESDGFKYYYIYDPNSRGATGLPSQNGVPCVVKFTSVKKVFDHILACLPGREKTSMEYAVVPAEIVVGSLRKRKKVKTDKSIITPKFYVSSTFPDKSVIMAERTRIRKIAEKDDQRKKCARLSDLGKTKIFEINNNKAIVCGAQKIITKDRGLPISVVAYILMKTSSDLDVWTYKQIDLILQAGDQLFIDSFNVYQPSNAQITLETLLRRVIIKDKELKIEIKKPLNRGRFTQDRLLEDAINVFNLTPSCILNCQNYFITLFFKSGYYYFFDPYGLDLSGNRNLDGSAALMRFSDLETMAQVLFSNLIQSLDQDCSYILIFLGITNVKSLSGGETVQCVKNQ